MRTIPFALDVEDGWPPVALESIPCEMVGDAYRILDAPLFIKDLSNGDVITVGNWSDGAVVTWTHIHRSGRTTIWLGKGRPNDKLDKALHTLRVMGCNTVSSPATGSYAIDVPEEVAITDVDACLASLKGEDIAIAYPSFRHPETTT